MKQTIIGLFIFFLTGCITTENKTISENKNRKEEIKIPVIKPKSSIKSSKPKKVIVKFVEKEKINKVVIPVIKEEKIEKIINIPTVSLPIIKENWFKLNGFEKFIEYNSFKKSDLKLWNYCKDAMIYYEIYLKKISLNQNSNNIEQAYKQHISTAKQAIKFYKLTRGVQ